MFQTLFLKGIKLTSAAMATAMPNLAPGLVFLIAWTVRYWLIGSLPIHLSCPTRSNRSLSYDKLHLIYYCFSSWDRLERVNISCLYSKVKIVGTLLCVAGALTMSLIHSTATKEAQMTSSSSSSSPSDSIFDKQKIIGCLYLMAAVLILSSNVVLQVQLLRRLYYLCYIDLFWPVTYPSLLMFK